MAELTVRLSTNKESPRTKDGPSDKTLGTAFSYTHSQDGTDENLLVLFHGLGKSSCSPPMATFELICAEGDTHLPFAKMGQNLKLPQCAILALRAPEKSVFFIFGSEHDFKTYARVPFLYEEAYQWYSSFDQLGELIERPNPSSTLNWLMKVLIHLTDDCKWPPNRIHLFGFSQGGSVAAELGLKWWRSRKPNTDEQPLALGSIVTVSGPLLSFPTIAQDARFPGPILFFHWSNDPQVKPDDANAFSKGFILVRDTKIAGNGGMPRSRDEWLPIMSFWSDVMGRRGMSGAYEVVL
jgi:predicted esterase